jgi:hypothetical protein
MTKLSDIVFERGDYWVKRAAKGFEVYKIGATASTRCAIIGFEGQKGLDYAKQEIERRESHANGQSKAGNDEVLVSVTRRVS